MSRLFGEFDEAGANRRFGVRRRHLFTLSDLLVHIQDFDRETDGDFGSMVLADDRGRRLAGQAARVVVALDPAGTYSPFDAHATRFYAWEGSLPRTGTGLVNTLIAGRLDQARTAEVCRIFEELDSTDFPAKMGTRWRQLYLYRDVYLHLQHFTRPDGEELIDQAWRDADPRFIKACTELMAIIPPYDPTTWAVPVDSLATCFYQWEEKA